MVAFSSAVSASSRPVVAFSSATSVSSRPVVAFSSDISVSKRPVVAFSSAVSASSRASRSAKTRLVSLCSAMNSSSRAVSWATCSVSRASCSVSWATCSVSRASCSATRWLVSVCRATNSSNRAVSWASFSGSSSSSWVKSTARRVSAHSGCSRKIFTKSAMSVMAVVIVVAPPGPYYNRCGRFCHPVEPNRSRIPAAAYRLSRVSAYRNRPSRVSGNPERYCARQDHCRPGISGFPFQAQHFPDECLGQRLNCQPLPGRVMISPRPWPRQSVGRGPGKASGEDPATRSGQSGNRFRARGKKLTAIQGGSNQR